MIFDASMKTTFDFFRNSDGRVSFANDRTGFLQLHAVPSVFPGLPSINCSLQLCFRDQFNVSSAESAADFRTNVFDVGAEFFRAVRALCVHCHNLHGIVVSKRLGAVFTLHFLVLVFCMNS